MRCFWHASVRARPLPRNEQQDRSPVSRHVLRALLSCCTGLVAPCIGRELHTT